MPNRQAENTSLQSVTIKVITKKRLDRLVEVGLTQAMKSNHWFKQAQDARDREAIFQWLVEDNERRRQRGLPTYEPSYELAQAILDKDINTLNK